MDKCKILIVDDNSTALEITKTMIEANNMSTLVANSGYRALSILENEIPDLILLDINMPKISGIETAIKIRENYNIYNIPIIFVSSENDSETIAKCFEIGAFDYIRKPYDAIETMARIKAHISISKRLQSKSDSIYQDLLTSALNRRAMGEILKYNLDLIQRNGGHFSLCFIDLDKFKELNDTYGHDAGDLALTNIAETIRGSIRKTDLLFRYGGDEFLIFFNGANESQAEMVIKRIKDKKDFTLDFSYGITQVNDGNHTVCEIIQLCDNKMYEDKKSKKSKNI